MIGLFTRDTVVSFYKQCSMSLWIVVSISPALLPRILEVQVYND